MEKTISNEDEVVRKKKPNFLMNLMKGIGFWVIAFLILGVVGLGALKLLGTKETIELINTKSEAVEVEFIETETHKEYLISVDGESLEKIKVKNGTYNITVTATSGKLIRTIDAITVSGEGFDDSFIDLYGDTSYIVMDITYMYEGNEALESDSYIEISDGSKLIVVPDRTYTIRPNDTIPQEVDDEESVIVMIPVTESEMEIMDDVLWNEIVVKYFEQRL